MFVQSLAYLGVESPRAAEWAKFAPEVLGADVVIFDDRGVKVRVDDRHHRIAVHPGAADQVAYIGWEVASLEALDELRRHLDSLGWDHSRATEEELADRCATEIVVIHDPVGFRHEFALGLTSIPGAGRNAGSVGRFVTGDQGLGHVVLAVPDLVAMRTFALEVLKFRLTDVMVADGFSLEFFRCNPRHHSLAIIEIPNARRISHLMLQAREFDDVGFALDACRAGGAPIRTQLGRHTNDRMVSFYLTTPSAFDIEYGFGGISIDDEDSWAVSAYTSSSIWGHQRSDDRTEVST